MSKPKLYLIKEHVNDKLILVHSDAFHGALFTPLAYKELKRQMALGDLNTHKAVDIDPATAALTYDLRHVITLELVTAMFKR